MHIAARQTPAGSAAQALHPVFDRILTEAANQQATLRRAEYMTALHTLDWQHEFSDDDSVRRRGRAQILRIRELQPVVDPNAALFNAHRPGNHGDVTL